MRGLLVFSSILVVLAGFCTEAKPTQEINDVDMMEVDYDDLNDEIDEFSELALFGDDNEETRDLSPDQRVFSEFCIRSRDDVQAKVKSSLNGAVLQIFNVIFNTVDDANEQYAMTRDKEAVKQGVEALKKAGIEEQLNRQPSEERRSRREVEKDIKENVEQAERGLFGQLTNAVKVVIKAIFDTVVSETSKRLVLLKEKINVENARDQIENACRQIITMKYMTSHEFEATLGDLRRSEKAAELQKTTLETNFDDLGCLTTSRLSKVARFCDIVTIIGPVFYPLVGL